MILKISLKEIIERELSERFNINDFQFADNRLNNKVINVIIVVEVLDIVLSSDN